MTASDSSRPPGRKLLFAILIGLALAIPLFSVWLLVYDRQNQSTEASRSITEGWGGAQAMSGPVLVIPYKSLSDEVVGDGLKRVVTRREVWKELTLQPEVARIDSTIDPEIRKRSIYEAVIYTASAKGQARFALPSDLARYGVAPEQMDLAKAELRFGLSDPRGLGANPAVTVDGRRAKLQPGGGSGSGKGFFAFVDANSLTARPMIVGFDYAFRGNQSLSLAPMAGDTVWTVKGQWGSPSFGGSFLPMQRTVTATDFKARYPIGNLALGQSLVATADKGQSNITAVAASGDAVPAPVAIDGDVGHPHELASINLIQPVDLYSRVDRAVKYGFLFIGFTFLALLMFDIIGGVKVSAVEYLLTGAAIVLFFVLLLAFAEVIGFLPAYIVASLAIAGLNTAYAAAVLKSWKRGQVIGGLLIALYAMLYILLGLEAFSLLIGSLLLFAALAGVMYVTRNIDWSGEKSNAAG
jgi:inner membrane protein